MMASDGWGNDHVCTGASPAGIGLRDFNAGWLRGQFFFPKLRNGAGAHGTTREPDGHRGPNSNVHRRRVGNGPA